MAGALSGIYVFGYVICAECGRGEEVRCKVTKRYITHTPRVAASDNTITLIPPTNDIVPFTEVVPVIPDGWHYGNRDGVDMENLVTCNDCRR